MNNIQIYVNKEKINWYIYKDIDSHKLDKNIFNDDNKKDLMDENKDLIIKGKCPQWIEIGNCYNYKGDIIFTDDINIYNGCIDIIMNNMNDLFLNFKNKKTTNYYEDLYDIVIKEIFKMMTEYVKIYKYNYDNNYENNKKIKDLENKIVILEKRIIDLENKYRFY